METITSEILNNIIYIFKSKNIYENVDNSISVNTILNSCKNLINNILMHVYTNRLYNRLYNILIYIHILIDKYLNHGPDSLNKEEWNIIYNSIKITEILSININLNNDPDFILN